MVSRFLVFLQFFIIFLMLLPVGAKTTHLYMGLAILMVGLVVGLLAIKEHKPGNFNIIPDIKESCELVTTGVYAFVRHPMYLSVILLMFGVSIIFFTPYEFVLFGVLFIVLNIKLLYEEHLWKCHSAAYAEYKRKTKRLIPFIY